jgi:hypothetical protein
MKGERKNRTRSNNGKAGSQNGVKLRRDEGRTEGQQGSNDGHNGSQSRKDFSPDGRQYRSGWSVEEEANPRGDG